MLEVYVFSRQSIGVHVSGHRQFLIILYVKKVKERVVLLEIHLRTTGRHLSVGSHSVICHPTHIWAFWPRYVLFCIIMSIIFVKFTKIQYLQSCLCRKFNLFLGKSTKKLLPPELLLLAQVCTKLFVGWGFAFDLTV